MRSPLPVAEPPDIVLDSNVLFDWLVFRNPGVTPLVRALESGQLRWLTSPAVRGEVQAVLARGQLSRWQPDEALLWATWNRWAHELEPPPLEGAALRLRCRDPDDQKFVDLALSARAQWLLSRDRAVLALARRARPLGLAILTPEAWACAMALEPSTAPASAPGAGSESGSASLPQPLGSS